MSEFSRELCLNDFIFDLPEELIAQHPLEKRDESRLLVRNTDGTLEDRNIGDMVDLLPSGSLLVINNTRVFPSRLFGWIDEGSKKAEVLLLREMSNHLWMAIGKPGRFFQEGTKIFFAPDCFAYVVEHRRGAMEFSLKFSMSSGELATWLDHNGYIPLPPYIHRPQPKPADNSEDRESYQTVYASIRGSVAAPTAGLHFTSDLMNAFKRKGIGVLPITLHVGAGTFLPVKQKDLSQHQMHSESFFVPSSTDNKIQNAKKNGNKVIAVGTTSLRCLESYYRACQQQGTCLADTWLDTELFIYPKRNEISYKPSFLDGLMTNFHQPGSTLFMLISALLSMKEAHHVYAHAVNHRYRFLSYGDASLFWL